VVGLQVLVIGATNLRSTLDPALLRAGRFDRVVRLGLPNELNRLKILQVTPL
jgi:ATP-dependent 26S proteasome regulatory subunit